MADMVNNLTNINNLHNRTSDLCARLEEMENEIMELKQRQQKSAAPTIIIEKVYVRKVDVDKLDFDLDKMSVDDLIGKLKVGIGTGGKEKECGGDS